MAKETRITLEMLSKSRSSKKLVATMLRIAKQILKMIDLDLHLKLMIRKKLLIFSKKSQINLVMPIHAWQSSS